MTEKEYEKREPFSSTRFYRSGLNALKHIQFMIEQRGCELEDVIVKENPREVISTAHSSERQKADKAGRKPRKKKPGPKPQRGGNLTKEEIKRRQSKDRSQRYRDRKKAAKKKDE